jgi:DNA-binding response OmpR family regulator
MPDRILIADDQEDIRNLVKIVLECEGFEVVPVGDGDSEIRAASESRPDLILQDVVLGNMNGFQVCKTLKSQTRTQHIPVLIFSVLNRDVDRTSADESGADGYIAKPANPDALVKEIRLHLEETKLTRFSRTLGLRHSSLTGRKILLSFDPSTPYERVARDFVIEALANRESVTVFTSRGSVVERALQDELGIELVTDIREFVTPILLRKSGNVSVLFDNLTDLTLSTSLQATYVSIRNILTVAEGRVTMLFLLNPGAHSPSDVQLLRGLFNNQVFYGQDGLKLEKMTNGAAVPLVGQPGREDSEGDNTDAHRVGKEQLVQRMNEILQR